MSYELLHPTIKSTTRFKEILKGQNVQPVMVDKDQNFAAGKALFLFAKGLAATEVPTDGSSNPMTTKLTNELYDRLTVILNDLYPESDKDFKGTQYRVAMPEMSPFIVVFGKTVVQLPHSKDWICVKWIIQNVQQAPNSEDYYEMGGMFMAKVNEGLNVQHPELMQELKEQKISLDKVLELMDKNIVLPS